MRLSLSFSMDSAAFDGGDNSVDEVVRILHNLAAHVDFGGTTGEPRGTIHDVNGNTIGSWEVTEDQD